MERRTFLGWVGLGWIASSLPVAIASLDMQSAKAASGDFKPIGTVSQLNSNGQILIAHGFGAEPVLVVRDPKTAKVVAVNPTCSHRGCHVDWKPDRDAFVCPCHHAQFSPDGEVLRGPASEPLQTYVVEVQGQQVLLKGPSN